MTPKFHLAYLNDMIFLLNSNDEAKVVESLTFIKDKRCGTFEGDNDDNNDGGNGDNSDGDDGNDDFGYAMTELSDPAAAGLAPNPKRSAKNNASSAVATVTDSFAPSFDASALTDGL